MRSGVAAEDAATREVAESLILRPEMEWAINRSDPEFKMLSLLGNPGAEQSGAEQSGAERMRAHCSAGGIRSR